MLGGVTVTVYLNGTANLATLKSTYGGASKPNPFTNDSDGTLEFYATTGHYDVVYTRTGYSFDATSTTDVYLFDPLDTGTTLASPVLSGTITGTYTLGGTPTISSPILSGTATGTYTLGGTPTISSPILSGTATGTYTLGGTPTVTAPILSGNVTGTYTAPGLIANVATIAALKAITPGTLTTGNMAVTQGYYAAYDAGGSLYRWDGASVVADDGGAFIQPTAGGTGRWRLVHNGSISVLQYGAKADGTTNDAPAIQAAIAYGTTNNQHIHLPGFISAGTEAVYQCTSQVSVPANRSFKLTMHGGHWRFTSALAANAGLLIDSCMMSRFDLQGEIIYAGTGAAVSFKPVTNVPVDAVKVIIDSFFHFTTVVNTTTGGGSAANVEFDPGSGNITGNIFEFIELNGEGAAGGGGVTSWGIEIVTPGVSLGFTDNVISCTHIHNHNSAGVQVGISTTRATQIARNAFYVNVSPNATKDGFNCFGVKNHGVVNVGNGVGTPTNGIYWQSTADQNIVTSTELAATNPINDTSTTKANLVNFKTARVQNGITVGGSPYAYQNISSRVELVSVTGGTVSAVASSVDGTNYFATGFISGTIVMQPGDYLKVTYTGLPVMNKFI